MCVHVRTRVIPFTNPAFPQQGRMLVQAGEEEDIVYADIGEWCSSERDVAISQ